MCDRITTAPLETLQAVGIAPPSPSPLLAATQPNPHAESSARAVEREHSEDEFEDLELEDEDIDQMFAQADALRVRFLNLDTLCYLF